MKKPCGPTDWCSGCSPPDGEGIPAEFERERVKGVFAWADHQPLAFYAFPGAGNIWLFYSFYSRPR